MKWSSCFLSANSSLNRRKARLCLYSRVAGKRLDYRRSLLLGDMVLDKVTRTTTQAFTVTRDGRSWHDTRPIESRQTWHGAFIDLTRQ